MEINKRVMKNCKIIDITKTATTDS